jgi:hypothetical protein
VLSNCFENDYENAEAMLARVENYRASILKAREDAIADQISISEDWKRRSNTWTWAHYIIGTTALLLSTFSAAKPQILGLKEAGIQTVAWLVAFSTGLLTFLNPEKGQADISEHGSLLTIKLRAINQIRAISLSRCWVRTSRGKISLLRRPIIQKACRRAEEAASGPHKRNDMRAFSSHDRLSPEDGLSPCETHHFACN